MASLDTQIEKIAIHLVTIELDDLPAFAKLHEELTTLSKDSIDQIAIVSEVAQSSADLIGKIILNKINDKKSTISLIKKALECMQSIIQYMRELSEISFPKEPVLSRLISLPFKSDSEICNDNWTDENLQKFCDSLIITIDKEDISLIVEFISEGREYCTKAEQILMELESDVENKLAVDSIFRCFHNIKGAASFLDMKSITFLSHESESLLDQARKGRMLIKDNSVDIILSSISSMRELFNGVEKSIATGKPFDGSRIVIPRVLQLRELISSINNENRTDSSEQLSARLGDVLVDMGVVTQLEIDVALTKKESPQERIGETLVRHGKVTRKAVEHALKYQKLTKDDIVIEETVRIDVERIKKLMDKIVDLVDAESIMGKDENIVSIASTITQNNFNSLNKITNELYEIGTTLRLVPIKQIFKKISRVVSDLSAKSGKVVNLTLLGDDLEVDRKISENVSNPMMHMIRNCVDHGLESSVERMELGKPEVSQIWVRAFFDDDNILFEIEDDGRGLDKDLILSKAYELNLAESNKKYTDKEIYNIILMPGFSTAANITDISGRGVGMDIVKKNIDEMNGILEIETTPGNGTRFIIKVPFNNYSSIRIDKHRSTTNLPEKVIQ